MSDQHVNAIRAVSPVDGTLRVQPVSPQREITGGDSAMVRHASGVAAVTGGNLPAAVAELVVDPDTHDVLIRIKDASTHAVISEYPSREVEALGKFMKHYADTLARSRVARKTERS